MPDAKTKSVLTMRFGSPAFELETDAGGVSLVESIDGDMVIRLDSPGPSKKACLTPTQARELAAGLAAMADALEE